MTKIRVYELAQQMGIDNKELLAKLKEIGVEAKTHTSVIDEADAKKLTAPPPVKDVEKEEVRVTTTVIRRRAKMVEAPAEAPAAAAEAAPEKEPVKAEEAVPPRAEVALVPELTPEPPVKKEVVKGAPAV